MADLRAPGFALLILASFSISTVAPAEASPHCRPDATVSVTMSGETGQLPKQTPSAEEPCATAMISKTGVSKTLTDQRRSKLPEAATAAIQRAKQFKVAYRQPKDPSGDTLVLLHGSGGDETTLLPLASRASPHASLIGVAGRVTQEGTKRWYQRLTPTSFDQKDIRAEAAAFADFLEAAQRAKTLDLDHTVFVGYSNGANLLAALCLLHPGLVERAVLLRPMPVLEDVPSADLSRSRFLMVIGEEDETYAPFGPGLEKLLRDHGARVDARVVKAGHLLGDEDVEVVAAWLDRANAVSQN
jgi:predicted esterase